MKILENFPYTPEAKDCHDYCIKLMKDKESGLMTESDFFIEVAYIALKYGFDELKPKKLPEPPDSLKEYLSAKSNGIVKKVTEDFWFQPDLIAYRQEESQVRNENDANRQWICKIYEWLPTDDTINKLKITSRLKYFDDEKMLAL